MMSDDIAYESANEMSVPSEIFTTASTEITEPETEPEKVVFTGRHSRPTSPTMVARRSFSSVKEEKLLGSPVVSAKKVQQPELHPDFLNCEQITVVPDADIALLVGAPDSPERRKIFVSSTILAIGSSYFRAILMPNRFTEGISFHRHKSLELNLFDDEPVAVTTVCYILHLQSHKVPKCLNGDELAEVAIVLDKYDCIQAAWAWTRHWMAGDVVRQELAEEGKEESWFNDDLGSITLLDSKEKNLLSKWVFIAWVFRDERVFKLCANALSWKMLEGDQADDEFFLRLPESLQRDLIDTRRACINDLHNCTQNFIDKFVEDGVCEVAYYYGNHMPRDCDARVIGTTMKGLREAELYPPYKIERWAKTASELLGDLRAVARSVFCADEHRHSISPSHMLLERLDNVREGMRRFTMDAYVRN